MIDLEAVVVDYLSKYRHVYTNTLYKALQIKENYNLSLNKFRLSLYNLEKSGRIESVKENVALPYWRLK